MLESEGAGGPQEVIRLPSPGPLADDGTDHSGLPLLSPVLPPLQLSPRHQWSGIWPGKFLPDDGRLDGCSVKIHGFLNIRLVAILGGLNLMIEILVLGRSC